MMMKGSDEAATSVRGVGASRRQCKKVSKFSQEDKENFHVYAGNVGVNESKSPLPVGFPRVPLQDITAILQPITNHSDEEDPSTGIRKPVTRSQGSRKLENVHTRVLSERISRNAIRSASNRGGPSKTRKKQAIEIAVDESMTVALAMDLGLSKEETVCHMINISRSVKLTELTAKGKKTESSVSAVGETSVLATEETHASSRSAESVPITDKENELKMTDFSDGNLTEAEQRRTAAEEPLEGSAPSASGTGSQFYQEQKKRKPLSARSAVSSFR